MTKASDRRQPGTFIQFAIVWMDGCIFASHRRESTPWPWQSRERDVPTEVLRDIGARRGVMTDVNSKQMKFLLPCELRCRVGFVSRAAHVNMSYGIVSSGRCLTGIEMVCRVDWLSGTFLLFGHNIQMEMIRLESAWCFAVFCFH